MKLTKFIVGATAMVAFAAYAESPAPADVQYDDYGAVAESLTGVAGDPVKGAEIWGDKGLGNCVACHVLTSNEATFQGTVGPSLDGVGDRWEEAELRGIVADAKMTFEGSMMPSFYKSSGYIRPGEAYTGKAGAEPLPTLLSAQDIEDVVAYLMTIKE